MSFRQRRRPSSTRVSQRLPGRILLRFLVQIERKVLLVQPLLAKVVELELSREVPPDDVLYLLGHLWLVQVPVDLGERLDFLCKIF